MVSALPCRGEYIQQGGTTLCLPSTHCPNVRNTLVGPQVVSLQILALDLGSRHKPAVLLFHNLDFVVLHGEFEHGYSVLGHELCGNGAAYQIGKFRLAVGDILVGLDYAVLVRAALGLNGDDELTAVAVYAHVHFVDFDLADALEVGAQVVLQRVGGDAEKDVDQPVVAHLGEQGLLVAQGVGGDDLGCRVRHFDGDQQVG